MPWRGWHRRREVTEPGSEYTLAGVAWTRLRRVLPALVLSHLIALVALLVGPALIAAIGGHPALDADAGAVSLEALGHRLHYWDGGHYIDIAVNGYPLPGDTERAYLNAFLPGYPLLMRAVMAVGVAPELAGVIVSLVAAAIALVGIDLLVSAERGGRTGLFAVWLVALAPFGFFFSAVYTESAFIAATAFSLYLARRGSIIPAALAATGAASVRITGVVLIPVLLVEWARHSGVTWRPRPNLVSLRKRALLSLPALVLPLLPLACFSLYLAVHFGDINGFRHAQTGPSFNHDLAWPWDGFWRTESQLRSSDTENAGIFLREVTWGVAGLIACIVGWADWRFPRSLALYCSLVWIVSTSLTFWLSIPRYLLAMFPIIIVIADLTRRARWLRPVLVVASAGAMTWGSAVYSIGHWLG